MNEKGSLTIEAAIALPLFLCFGVVLSWLLLLAKTEAALREAVEEAVKTTAVHAYPLQLLTYVYPNHPIMEEMENRMESFLPHSIKAILQEWKQQSDSANGGGTIRDWSGSGWHRAWAAPFVMLFVDENASGQPLLDAAKLSVSSVVIPDFLTDETSYFGLAAEYRITLPIPWVRQEIVLTAAALERCWVGDK